MSPRVIRGCALVLLVAACAVARPGVDWARQVDGLRRKADRHIDKGELEDAKKVLDLVFELPRPEGAPTTVLLMDAHFAMGTVHLLAGKADLALRQADAGLALAPSGGQSVFVANLHALRGMSLEELGKPLDAVVDYETAIGVHKALFDEALR